ncbi:caspase domain-containing protein [Mycena olivaceomarginata]|nr:caspase domain-containing protein [Mycena olivaceomarginata]
MTVTIQLREPDATQDRRCPVFALVIGIDEYLSDAIPNLRGCVNDAQAVKTYLADRFHMPEAQLAFLSNQNATRANILATFESHLIDNPSVQEDDVIIVYYAGHGSRATAPDSWPSTDSKIETLVPHDERTKTPEGAVIHGIPDYTLNALLNRLASAKGNNITVILDCGYSASATRARSSFGMLPVSRAVETRLPIPENLDQDLLVRTGEDSLPEGTNHKFMHSHVVLAACRQQQSAQECLSAAGEPRGFFTNGLIKQLRRVGPNRITYADLVDLLPTLPHQNPQCEGANTERCIFDVEGPAQTYTLAVNEDGTMEVDAGTVHGVVVGTQFALNADQEDADRILVAASVSVDSSALIPVAPGRARVFPDGGRIVVADWHKDAAMMSVYIRTSEDPPLAAADASAHSHGRTSFLVVDSPDSADLAVARTEKDEFALTRLDAKLSRYELLDVRLPASTANLPTVLDAIAHFNYFLAKRPAHDALALSDVRLEMYNLRGEYGARVPNMEQGNLVDAGGEVRFRLDTQEKYGFAICNYSRRDLFAYLFYFDPASYSIDAWYLPESISLSPPLLRRSSPTAEPTRLTVGYGPAGGYAFQFVVPEGVPSDTGFLKLFISTAYLDLRCIEQPAAVDVVYDGGREARGHPWAGIEEAGEMWGALDVAVTMYTADERPGDAPPQL